MTQHVWLSTSSHLIIVQHHQHYLQRKIRTSWGLLFLVEGLIVLLESSANLLLWALWKKYLRRGLQCWKKGMFLFSCSSCFSDPFVVVCTFLVMKLFSVCKFFFVHWYIFDTLFAVHSNNAEMLHKLYVACFGLTFFFKTKRFCLTHALCLVLLREKELVVEGWLTSGFRNQCSRNY